LFRSDPDQTGKPSYKPQILAQIVMPIPSFIHTTLFFEKGIKHFVEQGLISSDIVEKIKEITPDWVADVMPSLNIANDNALADTAPISGFLATIEASDTAAVAGFITALSKWAQLSSYELREAGQVLETATLSASIGAWPFHTGNVAQFDLQRKTPMPGSDELTDAKTEAAEARTDTKFERLGGKIDGLATTIVGKIESLKDDVSNLKDDISKSDQYNHDTRLVLISTFVVGFLALAGLLVAVVTYGDAIFGRGMNVRDVVHAVITEQQEIQKLDTPQPRH
jgi:hypothetical protein